MGFRPPGSSLLLGEIVHVASNEEEAHGDEPKHLMIPLVVPLAGCETAKERPGTPFASVSIRAAKTKKDTDKGRPVP